MEGGWGDAAEWRGRGWLGAAPDAAHARVVARGFGGPAEPVYNGISFAIYNVQYKNVADVLCAVRNVA